MPSFDTILQQNIGMTQREVNTHIAGILTVMLDVDPKPIPKSSIYLAQGMDLTKHLFTINLLVKAGWAIATAETMQLTPQGRGKAQELKAILEKEEAKDKPENASK